MRVNYLSGTKIDYVKRKLLATTRQLVVPVSDYGKYVILRGYGSMTTHIHQSAPKIIIQILIVGSQIFGKALFEAGRQAVRSWAISSSVSMRLV